jgi:DNA-binding LytR/AlgR family response regulator
VAVVDDDETLHDILLDLYSDSDIIDIKYNYTEPRKFIKDAPNLNFDLCFIDITMPELDGLTLAQMVKKKPFIFITGSEDRLKEALGLLPIDVVTKPFNKERLDHAVEKAYKLINEKVERAFFNVAESKIKINIYLPDIVFVDTDDIDPRNKPVVMKDGEKYTFMNYTLDTLLSFAPQLVQVNRKQLISIDYIKGIKNDMLDVKDGKSLGMSSQLTLSRTYKNDVMKRIFYK